MDGFTFAVRQLLDAIAQVPGGVVDGLIGAHVPAQSQFLLAGSGRKNAGAHGLADFDGCQTDAASGDRTIEAGPGFFCRVPKGTVHRYENVGTKPDATRPDSASCRNAT